MISLESEHYIRFILLLIKGGTEALRETITCGLKKKDISLDKILDDNKKEICSSKEISNIQQDILYPPPPHFTDISKWDISLLSYISLNFIASVLTDIERNAAEKVNDLRKAVQAYSVTAEIETRKYIQISNELSMAITLLSTALPEQTRAKVHNLIASISSDQLDIYAAVRELAHLERRDAFFECIQSSLEIVNHKPDVEPCENVAGHFREARIGNNEVRETGMDTEDERKYQFRSDDGKNTQERETTGEKRKSLSDHFPHGQNNTQDHNVALYSSVGQNYENVEGAVPETKSLNEKEARNIETKRKQDESDKMVFGQGKNQKEFEKTAEVYTARMSNSSLFQQGEETQTLSIIESNQQLNKSIDNENTQVTSVNKNTNKARESKEDMEKMNSGTAASQANDQNKDGYEVDTEWQPLNAENANQSQAVNDQSKMRGSIPLSNQHMARSALDGHQPSSSSDITVHFYILLHPDFSFVESSDVVVVKIGSDLCGGWGSNKHVMSPKQQLSSGHIEFVYSLQIPKQLISGSDKYVTYKYLVIRHANSRNEKDKRWLWEHYIVNGHAGINCNRKLYVPKKWKSKEIWHQYDAVVNRKPKSGVFSWISDYMQRDRKLREDAENAVSLYSKRIFQRLNGDVIDLLETMMYGLRRIYQFDAKVFASEREMNTALGEHILRPIMCLYEEVHLTKANETEEQWQSRMNVQFTLLAILKVLDPFIMEQDNRGIYSRLSKAFLIHPDTDKKTCKELEFLKQKYPTYLKFFKEAFVMLGKTVVQKKKDPAWLYIMPMVHFLSGSCSPFDPVTDNVSHASKDPVWWGTSHIGENTTKTFKTHKDQNWDIPLQEVLETLKPLFQIDFLLPRTIVASLNLIELPETFETELIPVEICCAALVYFVKTTRQSSRWHKQPDDETLVCKCVQTVLKQLQTECKKQDCVDVIRWKVAAMVSLDLAKEVIYRDLDSYLTASSVKVFLLCTSLYHVCLQTLNKDTQAEQERNKARIEEIFGISINWLKTHCSNWENTDPCLKARQSNCTCHGYAVATNFISLALCRDQFGFKILY